MCAGIEPAFMVVLGQDNRHAVMDRFQKLIGVGGDDRTRLDDLRCILPTVPEAGEAKGSFVLKAYGIFPFVLFERNLIDHRVTARGEG